MKTPSIKTYLATTAIGMSSALAAPHLHTGENGQQHTKPEHTHQSSALTIFDNTLKSASEKGLSIAGEYVFEYSKVINGGINRRGDHRNLFVLDAELDLEKVFNIKKAVLFAQFQHATTETGGTLDTGDIQAYSNLEVESSIDELYEFWYQQSFANDKFRVKIGKVDANTEFNFVDVAGDFSNSSAGFSPTIFTYPTYPNPAMSINLFADVVSGDNFNLTLGYGLFDGASAVDGVETGRFGPSTFFHSDQSDDYFHVVQADMSWNSLGNFAGGGRASVGAWHHTGDFTKRSGGTEKGTTGYFFTFEQQLTQTGADSENGLYGFVQYGWADDSIVESDIKQHAAIGFVAQGAYVTRAQDSAGIYISFVDLADATATENETAIDLFYNCQINEHFSIKPELQYIANPSGSTTVSDAVVAQVRATISF